MRYEGRITGFTMGTGQTLALLPPQNATGNFVKIVQRLPVRVELTDYDSAKDPLFVGLSVVPLRLLQGTAHRAPRRGSPAARSPRFRKAEPWGTTGTPRQQCPHLPEGPSRAIESGDRGGFDDPPFLLAPSEENTGVSSVRPRRPQPTGDQPLVCRGGGGRTHLHGSARYHDRQRCAAVHRRRPIGVERRQRVGAHQLPRGQCHDFADHRLAVNPPPGRHRYFLIPQKSGPW